MARSTTGEKPIFVAVEGFITGHRFIAQGTRTREVIGPRSLWTEWDGTDACVIEAQQRLHADRELADQNRQRNAREQAEKAARPNRKVRAISTFEDFPGVIVHEGDLFDADHDIVRRCPEGFEELP